MHEHSLIRDLMRKLEELVQREGAIAVRRVRVRLGVLSHMSPEHFREHFQEASRGTPAQDALLDVEVFGDELDPAALDILLEGVELEFADVS